MNLNIFLTNLTSHISKKIYQVLENLKLNTHIKNTGANWPVIQRRFCHDWEIQLLN